MLLLSKINAVATAPLVMHGSSSVPPEYVAIVNQYGGDLAGARGVEEETIKEAAKYTRYMEDHSFEMLRQAMASLGSEVT